MSKLVLEVDAAMARPGDERAGCVAIQRLRGLSG